jgi:hypothetical protein
MNNGPLITIIFYEILSLIHLSILIYHLFIHLLSISFISYLSFIHPLPNPASSRQAEHPLMAALRARRGSTAAVRG